MSTLRKNSKKRSNLRREGVLKRNKKQLELYLAQLEQYKEKGKDKSELPELTEAKLKAHIKRLELENETLIERISNNSPKKVSNSKSSSDGESSSGRHDNFRIEIFSVKFTIGRKDRKVKNKKGQRKSGKKNKRIRTKTFVRSVENKPGLMRRYRDGLMGLSPKTHVFRLVREDTTW